MTQKEVDKGLTGLMATMDKQLGDLKKLLEKQKNADEQERLRKIQVGKFNNSFLFLPKFTHHNYESYSM